MISMCSSPPPGRWRVARIGRATVQAERRPAFKRQWREVCAEPQQERIGKLQAARGLWIGAGIRQRELLQGRSDA